MSLYNGTDEERWAYFAPVGTPDECWEWRGHRTRHGYGLFTYRGRRMPASRVALVMTGIALGDDQLACHHCDNPPCVNPAHLYAGTASDNMQDSIRRGRFNRATGERHHKAKFTLEQVRSIRLRVAEGETQASLAREFGVNYMTINRIVKRRFWINV